MSKKHVMEGRERLMTLPEVAGYLRVHNSTVYKLIRKGRLPAFKIGSDWRFDGKQIDRWMKSQNERPVDSDATGPGGRTAGSDPDSQAE